MSQSGEVSPTAHSKGFKGGKEERCGEPGPLGQILEGLMMRREFRAGAGMGKLMSSWEEVVGERLASETVPAKLEQGVLVVATSSGAWAAQVNFLSEEIRRKANELLGSGEVKQVRATVRNTL